MTGLEDSVKGITFYIDKNGEYKELGVLDNTYINIDEESTTEEYKNCMDTPTELEIDTNNYQTQKFIRQMKVLCKSDKEKKAERRYNKNNFRKFIQKRCK